MAYSTIPKPSLYFNTKLFTGNGSTQSITGVGFQPDWVWFKNRSSAQNHRLFDAVRGAGKNLKSNDTAAEIDAGTGTGGQLRTFDSDGFSVGSDGSVNNNGENIVAWNWKAGTTSGISGSADITPNSYSFNQTSGFSVVTYNGTDVAGNTVLHGLGAIPHVIFVKRRVGSGYDWVVYHKDDVAGLYLNSTGVDNDSSANNIWFNGAAPTSTVFSIGTDGRIGDNVSTGAFVAYSFAPKKGYSKFGKYIGNGNADGPFVYTGFKPAFVMWKKSSGTEDWGISDNKRDTSNVLNLKLRPNSNSAESTANAHMDFLSNGFKWRSTSGEFNASGGTYIYMAFAEEPLVANVGNSIPATAR